MWARRTRIGAAIALCRLPAHLGKGILEGRQSKASFLRLLREDIEARCTQLSYWPAIEHDHLPRLLGVNVEIDNFASLAFRTVLGHARLFTPERPDSQEPYALMQLASEPLCPGSLPMR